MDYGYNDPYNQALMLNTILIIVWTGLGIAVTIWIYSLKKRSKMMGALVGGAVGFLGGIFLGVIPLIFLWLGLWFLLPKLDKICPNCGKVNASNALACKYCNSAFATGVVGMGQQPAIQYSPPLPAARYMPPPVSPQTMHNPGSASPIVQAGPGKDSIFISYRRDDSADVTGRIYDTLTQRFGKEAIFKDIDSIPFGVDFRKHLKEVIGSCGVLIAIIGDHWLTISDQEGQRRLDDPADYVRIEIESALQRDVPVIPLLVKGARMPKEGELPREMKDLAFRNGSMVRNDPDFHPDMDRLIKNLEQQLKA